MVFAMVSCPSPMAPMTASLHSQTRGEFLKTDTVVIIGVNAAEDSRHVPAWFSSERSEVSELIPVKTLIFSSDV